MCLSQQHCRLGFAVLLKFFQLESRFPEDAHEIPPEALRHLALQVGIPAEAWRDYRWESRTVKHNRAEICEYLGFREATVADAEALETWLTDEILDQEHRSDRLRDAMIRKCRKPCIEPPAAEQIRRLVGSAVQCPETRFCETIFRKLNAGTAEQFDSLLATRLSEKDEGNWTLWQTIKGDPAERVWRA